MFTNVSRKCLHIKPFPRKEEFFLADESQSYQQMNNILSVKMKASVLSLLTCSAPTVLILLHLYMALMNLGVNDLKACNVYYVYGNIYQNYDADNKTVPTLYQHYTNAHFETENEAKGPNG